MFTRMLRTDGQPKNIMPPATATVRAEAIKKCAGFTLNVLVIFPKQRNQTCMNLCFKV